MLFRSVLTVLQDGQRFVATARSVQGADVWYRIDLPCGNIEYCEGWVAGTYQGATYAVESSASVQVQVAGTGSTGLNIRSFMGGSVLDSAYDGERFVNFTTEDGLLSNVVYGIHAGTDGVMWFATWGGGVSLYDGRGFVNFTAADGLLGSDAKDVHVDPDGIAWIATGSAIGSFGRGGVSRYDSQGFVNFTTQDGLPGNAIKAMHVAPDGMLWIGTLNGVSRYDGKEFVNFSAKDGLAHDQVFSIHSDPNGVLWFGTGTLFSPGMGISRYDGKEFLNFTTKDGLANNTVMAIHSDSDGVVWFGTLNGVSRYDGKEFVNFSASDGLAHNQVLSIHSDTKGALWFGTWGGISRYDAEGFDNHIAEVLSNIRDKFGIYSFDFAGDLQTPISTIHSDPDGVIWAGLIGLGVIRYDDRAVTLLTDKDGLPDSWINAIHRDHDGIL